MENEEMYEEPVTSVSDVDTKTDDFFIKDLTSVKEEKQLIDPTKKVKLRIKKVEKKVYKDGAFRMLNIQLQLVDGVDEEGKHKNKVVFSKPPYFADMAIYGGKPFFDKDQYLLELKRFLKAVGSSIEKANLNQEFFDSITGMVVYGDILQTKGNEQYGPDNEVKFFKVCDEVDV